MNKCVLDTSAVLAYLFEEVGAEQVAPVLEAGAGVISSVNYAELVGKLIDQGMPATLIRETLSGLELELVDHDQAQAFLTGELRAASKVFGLSLGDRACLALAIVRQLPVLTADRAWLNVVVQTTVRVIRG
jgi:PIN domain nuclease of toxin-antitoxin system